MKLQVWNIINPPASPSHYPVSSPEEGHALIERMASNQLRDRRIFANAFGLEVFNEEDNEWEDWYSDEGEELDEYMERTQGDDKCPPLSS